MTIEKLFHTIVPEQYASLPMVIEEVPLLPNNTINVSELNGKYNMSFMVLDDDEKKRYEASRNKRNFQGNSESIHAWNLEVKKYFQFAKKYDTSYHLIEDSLSNYENELPMEYLYLSHMILHEVGHYKQYLDKNKKVYNYINWNKKEYEKNYNKQNKLQAWYQTEIIFETITPEKEAMYNLKMRELAIEYRNIPNEKNADRFAEQHMKNAVEKIKIFLQKENQVN